MAGQPKGKVACGGVFTIFRTPTQGVKGTGPNGEVQFQDLWECEAVKPDGQVVPKYTSHGKLVPKVPYAEERNFHNKWTRRGLSYNMYISVRGHSGGGYNANVSEITYGNTRNPFLAFMMFADDTVNAKLGDARPQWDESDGQYDTLVSPVTGTVGEGRRGLLLSSTSGTLKRTSTLNIGTSPYGVLEYTFYAQPNSPAIETGDKGIDNFPIKGVGMAYAVACGDGEASSQLGVRAVCGKPPTFQGVCGANYVHEGQQNGIDLVAKEYALDDDEFGEVVGDAGYIQDGELAEVQIDSTPSPGGAGDTIVASSRTITLANAVTALSSTSGFDADAHTRKLLRLSGSGIAGNNRDYTIREVVSPTSVRVFEAPASDDAGNINAFTCSIYTSYAGHNAFDGRILNYGRVEATDSGTYPVPNDTPGTIQTGEIWASPDTGVTHTIGRIFGSTVSDLRSIRIMVPNDVNINYVPDNFTIQVLDPTANGGSPRPGYNSDWVTVSSGGKTGQAQNIYNAGVYGYEFTFDAIDARGVRLTGIQAEVSSGKVEIAELYAHASQTQNFQCSGKNLRLKHDNADAYVQHEIDDIPSTTSVSDLIDPLNKALRGYQLEAVHSTFYHLWIRSTVAGDNSELWLDAEGANGLASLIGLPTTETERRGITEPITKAPSDAMTIIYRVYMTGNVPGGYPA